jgi:MOSC domain-containing protein YiiM
VSRQLVGHDLAARIEDAGSTRLKSNLGIDMKLVSVNCGLPREIVWHGKSVTTSIYKEPVEGRIALRTLNLDGDRQADLSVHGGKDKAVYCYPIEHYDYWKTALTGYPLVKGAFGENFTIQGLDEDSVHIGDKFSVGSVEVVVTQPRLPCYKLDIKFGSDDMVKRFLSSGRTGFYLAVTREGDVGAGDELLMLSHDPNFVPVSEITRLYVTKGYLNEDVDQMQRALKVAALPEGWKAYFREKLDRLEG